jgi:O-acetyl-ADP-ribose deacetylase (regulator of RNase III)
VGRRLQRSPTGGPTQAPSIGFPAISTGIFGFPAGRCAAAMLATITQYLAGATELQLVVVILWTEGDFQAFAQEFAKYGGQPAERIRVIRKAKR